MAKAKEDQRYVDTHSAKPGSVGEVTEDTIDYFKSILHSISEDSESMQQWLGRYSTLPKQEIMEELYEHASQNDLEGGQDCKLSEYYRACYFKNGADAKCFINGEEWNCSLTLAKTLSEYQAINYSRLDENDKSVVSELADLQWLTFK